MIDESRIQAISKLFAETLCAGNMIRIRVNGTSMLPAVWPGDVLTVAPATSARPDLGDVALIAMHGRLFAHRVIERRACGGAVAVVTRGDALDCSDPMAAGPEILGTAVARNGREIRARRATRRTPFVTLAGVLARSAPLLALVVKVRALTRGRAWATV
jgi:hypothetical protein